MNNQTTKQKLIDLVSALETENSIEYFYRFIAMKLYGKADCPASFVEEVNNMYADYEKGQKEKEVAQKTGVDKEISDCTSAILGDVLAIGDSKNIVVLNYIRSIITDVRKEIE